MKIFYCLAILSILLFPPLISQSLYFPPIDSDAWESIEPTDLGWCPKRIDSLVQFLDEKDSKSFIILKGGRIALEKYFDNFTANSQWYFASVSKTVVAFLTGIAQQEGYLAIDNPVSDYLGVGWTVAPPDKEELITIWHQLTMTMGLDDTAADPIDCPEDTCFQYMADAGTRWAYHTSAYRKLQDVLEVATDMNKAAYTRALLTDRIGMGGFWLNSVRWGTARDMARFGLLLLNKGIWQADTLLYDQQYLDAMLNPSQDLNPSYGYLTWLNGQSSYLLPTIQFSFAGPLFSSAPQDMFAGLGLNDQKIYVVPSKELVIIRQGNSAGGVNPAASSFDNELWQRIMALECTPTAIQIADPPTTSISISPNPFSSRLQISNPAGTATIYAVHLRNLAGQVILSKKGEWATEILSLDTSQLAEGWYTIEVLATNGRRVFKLVKTK